MKSCLAVLALLLTISSPLISYAVMIATQQQMDDAKLPLRSRDYCAHHLIKLMKCKRDHFPNIFACKHERHDWDYCEHLE